MALNATACCYYWLTCLCVIFGTGILGDRKLEKRQARSSCPVDTFNCSNGQCIDSLLVCDGQADCSDSSDETRNLCSTLFKTCSSYSFRCNYGACVDKFAKCNGKKDCVDGSDENIPECKPNIKIPLKCTDDEYTCKSGQCIDSTSICDGVRDCRDGTDETLALCKTAQCSKYSFRCKYGACVNKNGRCDGVEQCADGSDEERCYTTVATQIVTPIVTAKPISVRPSTIKTTTQRNEMKYCVIPTAEGTLYYRNNGNKKTFLPPGTSIDQNKIVYEDCEQEYYKIVPNRFMICSESGQWEPLDRDQLCLKKCPPMISDSVDIHCSYNGEPVDCSKHSINGTKLSQLCKSTHGLPNGQVETPVYLNCRPNGKWSGELYKCVPNCGRTIVTTRPLIANGVVAKYGTAPWNVGLYKLKDGNYDMICGGSLISANLIVTAAHCFWSEGLIDRVLTYTDMYKIGVGKYERNISVKDNDFTQILNVQTIFLKNEFYGQSGFYAHDIAIIVLPTKVKISNVVLPVCLDWSSKIVIPNGSLGKVVGWGNTEHMELSPILLEVSIPFINQIACRNMYRNGFEIFVTSDKFCAGSKLGQGVLEGDSGAGYTQPHGPLGLHYLTGVVSNKNRDQNDSIALFTNVSHHIQWIREIYGNFNEI